MKINSISLIHSYNFKGVYYNTCLQDGFFDIKQIKVDDNPKLGQKPVLQTDKGKIPLKKSKDGKSYTTTKTNIENFKILYEDTGNIDDNNSLGYNLSKYTKNKMEEISQARNIKDCHHSEDIVISKGKVQGRLIEYKYDSKDEIQKILQKYKNESVVLLADKDCDFENIPDNVSCVIVKNGKYFALSHTANRLRNMFDFCVSTTNEEKISNLQKLINKTIEVSTQENSFNFKELNSVYIESPQKTQKQIQIPKMLPVNKIMESKDYKINNAGMKAYKLKLMQEIKNQGKINAIIPESIVIPYPLIYGIRNESDKNIHTTADKIFKRMLEIEPDIKYWIIRSNFNTEDLDDYSSAGLYLSLPLFAYPAMPKDMQAEVLASTILACADSINNKTAVNSRKKHNIQENLVRPSVIIQKRIPVDYAFTIYTKDPSQNDDILTVEMNRGTVRKHDKEPYIIKYNKNSKEMKLTALECNDKCRYTFDDKLRIVKSAYEKDSLLKNQKEIKPVLENAIKDALILEKELGAPQDIEGGIKDGEVYFWQTRNIVNSF